MTSVDDLDGASCQVGTPLQGVTRVSYAADGTVGLTCTPSTLYTLTVVAGDALVGTVTATPGGLTCASGTCTGSYAPGTTVTLTPDSVYPSTFSGWSGDCAGSAGLCTVTMSAARTVTARFVAKATVHFTAQNESAPEGLTMGRNTVTYSHGGDCTAGPGNNANQLCGEIGAEVGESMQFTVDPSSANNVDGWFGCTPSPDLLTCALTVAQGGNNAGVWFKY